MVPTTGRPAELHGACIAPAQARPQAEGIIRWIDPPKPT
jgi:hypothetical protein